MCEKGSSYFSFLVSIAFSSLKFRDEIVMFFVLLRCLLGEQNYKGRVDVHDFNLKRNMGYLDIYSITDEKYQSFD